MKKTLLIIGIFTLMSILFPIKTLAADPALTCQYKLYASGYKDNTEMTLTYTLYTDGTLQLPFEGKAIIKDGKWDAGGGFFDTLSFYGHEEGFVDKFKKSANPSTGKYKCPFLEDSGWDLTDSAYIIKISDSAGEKIVLEKETVADEKEQIKENQVCTYYIKEKLYDQEQASRVSSDTIKVSLAIDTAGRKYFYVQDTKSDYITNGIDSTIKIPVYRTELNGIKYYDNIRFVIKSGYEQDLFKTHLVSQFDNNKFDCPSKLYVIRDESYDWTESNVYSYRISATDDSSGASVLTATATGYTDDYKVDTGGGVVNAITGKPLDCSDFIYTDKDTKETVNLISELFSIIMIVGPILALVLGGVDFAKATLASDESALKKAGSNFAKRIIAAILLFLLPLIINLVLSIAFNAGTFGSDMEKVPDVCLTNK
jgi:hypothetical protein